MFKTTNRWSSRCRAAWSLSAASVAAAVIVVASGLRLDAAAPPRPRPPRQEVKPVQDVAKTPGDPKPSGETLHYTGTVRDKDTGKPIAGATVVVRRSVLTSDENRVLQETRHTTGADGTYSFTIPPEQVAERYLYIELDVEHPDYATRAGFGYALSMTRKNEKLNERPFFENIEMRPAEPITGRVETPEGAARGGGGGAGVLAHRQAYEGTVSSTARSPGPRRTPRAGFGCRSRRPAEACTGSSPRRTPPSCTWSPTDKRGDLGTITLKKGVTVAGRVFDVQGKPLAGVFVEAERERGQRAGSEALNQLIVSDVDPPDGGDRLRRAVHVRSVAAGGLPRRAHRLQLRWRPGRPAGPDAQLPGVFAPKKLTIKEGEIPAPLEVRASPSVVIEGHWLDSKGQPKSGWGSFVFGRIDGSFWNAQTAPRRPGQVLLEGPARPGGSSTRHLDQRARLGATPDRQGRAADRRPHGQAGHARP